MTYTVDATYSNGSPTTRTLLGPLRITTTLTVEDVSKTGIRVDFVYSNVRFDTAPPPEFADLLEGLDGLTGELELTSTGEFVSGELAAPPDASPWVKQTVDTLRSQLASLTTPYPTEPIGVGGRWRSRSDVPTMDAPGTMQTTYTVKSRTGRQIQLAIEYEESSGVARSTLAGLPTGLEARVISARTTGTGSQELKTSELIPSSYVLDTVADVATEIDNGAGKIRMDQHIVTNVQWHRQPPSTETN